MLYSNSDAFFRICSYISDIGIFLNEVIKKDSTKSCKFDLFHPGIFQRKSEKKCSGKSVSKHVSIIFFVNLKFMAYRLDDNFTLLFICCLSEAKNYIVTELTGGFIIHVFNKDAQPFLTPSLSLSSGIAHLNCSF